MSMFNIKSAATTAGLVLLLGSSAAMADTIYSSIPAPLPGNLPSLGYQATQTSEFGDRISFAGSARDLTTVTVTLSDWAKYSDYSSNQAYSPTGFSLPMTLNIYSVGTGNSVGSLIGSVTTTQNILWRPEVYDFNGIAQNVTFDFTGTTVPDEIIFGLVFDTQSYGPNPTGTPGPYNSLNFALGSSATIGTDVDPNGVYWNTSTHANYTAYDPSATAFQSDTNWSPYVPAVQFDAVVPEPSTLALFGGALFGLGFIALRRRKAGSVL